MELRPSHKRLADFAGHWVGGGEVFPNPWGPSGPSLGEWTFRMDVAGLNLVHDYGEVRPCGYRFDGHGVLTVDPANDDVLWFWFDSFGFPPLEPSRGAWDGSHLTLRKTTPRGLSLTRFTLDGDQLVYEVSTRAAGATACVPVASCEFVRQP